MKLVISLFSILILFTASNIKNLDIEETSTKKFPPRRVIKRIAKSDECYIYRLGMFKTNDTNNLAGFPIKGNNIKLDTKGLVALKKIVVSKDSYNLDGTTKRCIFTPIVGFKFNDKQKKRELIFLVSFDCDVCRIVYNGNETAEDIDPARQKLLAIAKKIFSDDKTIQKLN